MGSGVLIGSMAVVFFALCIIIAAIIIQWRIFVKAGYSGWVCLIPIYNSYCF